MKKRMTWVDRPWGLDLIARPAEATATLNDRATLIDRLEDNLPVAREWGVELITECGMLVDWGYALSSLLRVMRRGTYDVTGDVIPPLGMPSPDRLRPDGDYVEGQYLWVPAWLNYAHGDMTLAELAADGFPDVYIHKMRAAGYA